MMAVLPKFLAAYARSGLRGSYRLTKFLAGRMEALHKVPIQTECGTLYADLRIASSLSLLADPTSRSGEAAVMRRFVNAGDVVYDIGAHLGFYTLLLAELVGNDGKVFAFEPNPELLPSLKSTLRSIETVRLFEAGLSDTEGVKDLYVPEDASMASMSDWTDGIAGDVHKVQCDIKVIDSMIGTGEIPYANFIKCDVEGAELSIFKGASKALDRPDAPIILFEVNELAAKSFGLRTSQYFEFLETLENAKYHFFSVDVDGVKDLVGRELSYANILAVPGSKLGLLDGWVVL